MLRETPATEALAHATRDFYEFIGVAIDPLVRAVNEVRKAHGLMTADDQVISAEDIRLARTLEPMLYLFKGYPVVVAGGNVEPPNAIVVSKKHYEMYQMKLELDRRVTN